MDNKPIAIDYDPDSPAVARVHGGSVSSFGRSIGWVLVMPAAFAVAGLVVLFIGLLMASRARRIYRNGVSTVARVTALQWTSMRINQ